MNKYLLLTVAVLIFLFCASANAQLIGEGDTLWYKTGLPTITQVQFTPDGTKLGVYGEGIFIMYNSENGVELWRLKFPFFTNNFQFSIDGSLVYVLTPSEKTVFGYSSQTGEIIETNTYGNETNETYWNLWLTPNPNRFLFTSPTGKNAIYDKQQGSIIIEKLNNDNSKMYSSPYSNYFIKAKAFLVGNDWKFRVSLWDVNTLDFITNLAEEFGDLVGGGEAKISYNGKYAATNFGTRALQIWDLENKKLFKEYSPTIKTETTSGGGPQLVLAFGHDNETIINCGGYYLDDLKPASTTLTNFINDKRAIMFENKSFRALDIKSDDTQFAGGKGSNLVILKLKKDAVPVKDSKLESGSVIYPNPTSGIVNIPMNCVNTIKYEIFNSSGKLIKSSNLSGVSGNLLTIDFTQYPSGVYSVKFYCGKEVEQYQVVRGE